MNNNSIKILTIDKESAPQRIDNFLFKICKGVPRSKIYRCLRKGEVRVNKKRIKPYYKLQEKDEVRIPPIRISSSGQEKQAITISPQTSDLLKNRVLYEDQELLILNKPSGFAVHGGTGLNIGIIEALRKIYAAYDFLELGHRLDKGTSGCLMIAKTRSALRQIHNLLYNRQIKKTYLALLEGYWRGDAITVEEPLRKNSVRSGERVVQIDKNGKNAITKFTPHKRFDTATLAEVELSTGRTHQIRVHATQIGHPIAGDDKYGNKKFNKSMQVLGLKRVFLHAYSIEFTLPENNKKIRVKADLDVDLTNFLKKVK